MAEQLNQTREQILQAAMELFAEKGYHETSMAAIAERAGLGKGTLYWHFPGKDELFKQMITEKGERLFRIVHTVVSQPGLPTEVLREVIRVKLEFAVEEKDFSKILLNSMQLTDQEFKLKLFQMHRDIIAEIQQVIERGMETGVFHHGPVEQTTVAIIGMINGLTSTICFQKSEISIAQMTDLLFQMITHGIAR